MNIKEYYKDGSLKTEFDGSQYEYDRWLEKRNKDDGETTTIKRPKVVIQENVEKVTKYDVKNVVFSKNDVKEIFKNNPEKLQEILKHELENGGIARAEYEVPIAEVKEIFKKNPEKLQKILEADISNYGRFYTDFNENDVKEIFSNNPEKLQDILDKLAEKRRLDAESAKISASRTKTLVKGIAVGCSIGLSAVGIAGGIVLLVKNDIIPPPSKTAWIGGKK